MDNTKQDLWDEAQEKQNSQKIDKSQEAEKSKPQRYKIQFRDPRNRNEIKVYRTDLQLTASQISNALNSGNEETVRAERQDSEGFPMRRSLSFHPSYTLLRTTSKRKISEDSVEEIQNISRLGSMDEELEKEVLPNSPVNTSSPRICKCKERLSMEEANQNISKLELMEEDAILYSLEVTSGRQICKCEERLPKHGRSFSLTR